MALTFPRPRPCRGDGGDFSLADSSFEQFCQRYPRKEAKELARAVWHRLWRRGSLPGLDVLFQSLIRFRESLSWQREHGRFIPLLVNWLRGQRWLDDLQSGGQASLPAAPDSERDRRIKQQTDALEKRWQRTEPELEAMRPVFESFLSRFDDGQQKRGPAWGLWTLLGRKGKAPSAADVPAVNTGVLEFLHSVQYGFSF